MNENGDSWMDAWGGQESPPETPAQTELVSAKRVMAPQSPGTELESQHDAILELLTSMRENQHKQNLRFMMCNLLIVAFAAVYLEALRKDIRRAVLRM